MNPKIVFLVMVSSEFIHLINGNSIRIYNSSSNDTINKAIVHIIENCFSDIRCIIFGGSNDNRTVEAMNNSNMFSSVRLINLLSTMNLQYYHKKIDVMIINESDIKKLIPLKKKCQNLSIYTNEITVLVSRNDTRFNKNFVKNMENLWKCGFLNVYVFCKDNKKSEAIDIYTFNPYSDREIYKWKKVNVSSKNMRNKISWGMIYYYRLYSEDDICDGFNFDRTKRLNKLGLINAVVGKKKKIPKPDVGMPDYFAKALNTNVKQIWKKSNSVLNDFYSNEFLDITLSSININQHIIANNRPFTFSHPVYFYSMFIVTHNRGSLSPLEKIYNYYGFLIIFSTVIILTMTFIVIYLLKHNAAFAMFEILRLLINTGITVRMDTVKTRIFFSMIFLYFLIIHGTFSGRLAGFLTKFEYRKNVETLEELKDSQYKEVFAHFNAQSIFTNVDLEIKNKTRMTNFLCSDLIKNKSVACINDYFSLLRARKLFDLHQSKEPVYTGFNNYVVRKNWALKSRFNNVLIWLVHSGISTARLRRIEGNFIRRFRTKRRKALALVAYRPITFQDLGFSFVLLGIGLVLALLAFCSEIFIHRSKMQTYKQVKRIKMRRQIPTSLTRIKIARTFCKV